MASTATSAVSFVDPSRAAKYPVHLGAALKERQEPERRFWNLKFNHKPRQNASHTRQAVLHAGRDVSMQITDTSAADEEKVEHTYAGVKRSNTDSYALMFDRSSKSFTLEALAGHYALNITSDPSDPSTSHKSLTSRYGNAVADSDTAHANGTSEHTAEDDLFGGDALPDTDNPFDFRNYLSGLPGHTDGGRPSSTGASPAASPMHYSSTGLGISSISHNGGSSPLIGNSSRPGTGNNGNGVSRSTAAASSPNMGPAITRKRKTADIFAKTTRKPVAKKPGSPQNTAPAPQKPQTSVSPESPPRKFTKLNDTTSSPPTADEGSDLLIIEGDDEPPSSSRPGGYLSTPPGMRPRSLREVATSRDVSPAGAGRRPLNGATAAPQESRGGHGLLGRPRVDSGAASVRTDADVETDLDLGSPQWEGRRSGKDEQGQGADDGGEDVASEADEEDAAGVSAEAADEDDGDELSREIQMMLEAGDGDGEDGAGGFETRAPEVEVDEEEEEEEESEEE